MRIVGLAYANSSRIENSFRDIAFSKDDSLYDTFETAAKICKIDLKGFPEDSETKELRNGIRSVSGFLMDRTFDLSAAKIEASKAALLTSLLLFPENHITLEDLRYDKSRLKLLKEFQSPKELQSFNKLKKINVEASYYWHLITKVNENISRIKI